LAKFVLLDSTYSTSSATFGPLWQTLGDSYSDRPVTLGLLSSLSVFVLFSFVRVSSLSVFAKLFCLRLCIAPRLPISVRSSGLRLRLCIAPTTFCVCLFFCALQTASFVTFFIWILGGRVEERVCLFVFRRLRISFYSVRAFVCFSHFLSSIPTFNLHCVVSPFFLCLSFVCPWQFILCLPLFVRVCVRFEKHFFSSSLSFEMLSFEWLRILRSNLIEQSSVSKFKSTSNVNK